MSRIFSVLITLLFLFSYVHPDTYTLDLNKSNWDYDSTNGVYYQIGLVYCTKPVNTKYQSLGIFVPKEYFTCTESDSKYSCGINSEGKKGSYTASNAPMVLPVETPGYSSMEAPSSYNYETVKEFVSKGIIYIYAGCRGRYEGSENYIAGAPWPITDLKSAVRYVRYNKKLIPGDTDKIYTFGMSGGGAQSCLMGVTGNSALFTKYLEANGAAMNDADGNAIKDNVKGSQCWCPITNLDTAGAAYEWNIGQYYSTDTRADGTFSKLLSDDLTEEFVQYINAIKLKDPSGNVLSLTKTNEGTYYDYLKSVIEESLNNFLSDTTFPYTVNSNSQEFPREGMNPGNGEGNGFPGGEGPKGELNNNRLLEETTYDNISHYIDSLNSDNKWITYDTKNKKASITSVGDFIKHCKSPSKNVGAFDGLERSQGENKLFGISYADYTKHFDEIMTKILNDNDKIIKYSEKSDWNNNYPSDYKNDLTGVDSLNNNITMRSNMYNPMYYLIDYYDGYKSSDVADYFRINSGLFQSDTGNVVEMNLFLALKNYGKNVEFTTVWEKKHVEAERTGEANSNFIAWIEEIEKAETNTDFSGYIYISYLAYVLSLLVLL